MIGALESIKFKPPHPSRSAAFGHELRPNGAHDDEALSLANGGEGKSTLTNWEVAAWPK